MWIPIIKILDHFTWITFYNLRELQLLNFSINFIDLTFEFTSRHLISGEFAPNCQAVYPNLKQMV